LSTVPRQFLAALVIILLLAYIQACSHESVTPSPPSGSRDLVMPNLIGKYWSDADPDLRRAGWEGLLIKGPNLPVQPQERNRIMRQLPPAGEHIKSDDPITLQFGM
jgi:serine/threonine-protein kinase